MTTHEDQDYEARLLVVDDEPNIRDLLATSLRFAGFEVFTASTGNEAIREATERGEFDNLPGAGKPIEGLNGREDPHWWVKGLLRRENLTPVLPTALSLRKEAEVTLAMMSELDDEDDVRELLRGLNERIADAIRRPPAGPAVHLSPVDIESAVQRWRSSQRG